MPQPTVTDITEAIEDQIEKLQDKIMQPQLPDSVVHDMRHQRYTLAMVLEFIQNPDVNDIKLI